MKTKSNYLMVFLIITFGVDVLDRHMKIEIYNGSNNPHHHADRFRSNYLLFLL